MNTHPKPYTVATFTPNFKQGEEVWFFTYAAHASPRLRKGYIHRPVIANSLPGDITARFNQKGCEVGIYLKWEIADDYAQSMEKYADCGTQTLPESLLFRSKDEALASLTP